AGLPGKLIPSRRLLSSTNVSSSFGMCYFSIMKSWVIQHTRIKATKLVPHETNFRPHANAQRAALQALYDEIGFARSLLAYELPDGRLKLIDGHLRATVTPDEMLDVEILDVNDAEARALLLAIDPLAQLAGYDTTALDE